MIYQGDTVRLRCNFHNFEGEPIDPTEVIVTFYDSEQVELEVITLTEDNKDGIGNYFYDYVAPALHEVIFEFKGLNEGNPIVIRDSIKIKFN